MSAAQKKNLKTGKNLTIILAAFFLTVNGTACAPFASAESADSSKGTEKMVTMQISPTGTTFTAFFYDNPTAKALLDKMPLTITMTDLNRNEKYYNLADPLPPSTTERPPVIRAGEIMYWSGQTLVLFYRTFSNSYGGYTRLGYVEKPEELANALGTGAASITFSLP